MESYSIVTEDGYVSQIYRIPGMVSEVGQQIKKPVVLLQHGLMADMMFWVVNTPEKAPAFTLVREGYDVWLGNNRGSRFAKGHTHLSLSEQEYWEFTFLEMGVKD